MATASSQAGVTTNPGSSSEEQRRLAALERAHRTRQKQSLDLQRERILSQRTSNPGRRAALEAALKEIEAQIETLS